MMPRKVTPPEYAKRIRVKADKVVAWIKSGELRAIDVSSRNSTRPRYVIDEADIADFERRREVQPRPKQARKRKEKLPAGFIEFY